MKIYDIYPHYNVLSDAALITSYASDFRDSLKGLEEIWSKYATEGNRSAMTSYVSNIMQLYQTDSINYQALVKSAITLNLALTPLAPVSPFINMVIGFVRPFLFGSSKEVSMFDQIMDAVKKEMEHSFEQFTLNNLNDTINGLKTDLYDFTRLIDASTGVLQLPYESGEGCKPCKLGENSPCAPCYNDMIAINSKFQALTSSFNNALPHFKDPLANVIEKPNPGWNQEYITMCLPLYTLVATLELLTYQGYIQFAEKWRIPADSETSPITTTQIANMKANLRQRIQEHSNDIYTTFIKYLPKVNENATKGELNDYIRYHRVITLQCLDFVATWPFLDSRYYQSSGAATINFTRMTYLDIVGPVEDFYNDSKLDPSRDSGKLILSIKDINGKNDTNKISDVIAPLSLFYDNLELKSLKFNVYNSSWHCYINGYQGIYNSLSNDVSVSTNTNNLAKDLYLDFPLLNKLNMRSYAVGKASVDDSMVYVDDDSDVPSGNGHAIYGGCNGFYTGGPHSNNTLNYDNQIIQAIYEVTASNPNVYTYYYNADKTGYLATLSPIETTLSPIIGTDFQVINTVPAEQVISTSGTKFVEYITGSAVLELKPNQTAKYSILNQGLFQYKVRARVATTDSGSLSITMNNKTINLNIINTKNYTDPTTAFTNLKIQGKNGSYMVFPLSDAEHTTFDNVFNPNYGTVTMEVTNNSNTNIIIDRFEFIPYAPSKGTLLDTIPETIRTGGDSSILWKSTTGIGGQQVDLNIVIKDPSGIDVTTNYLLQYGSSYEFPLFSGQHSYPAVLNNEFTELGIDNCYGGNLGCNMNMPLKTIVPEGYTLTFSGNIYNNLK
uniref:Crystaline entomocidal protoxin n=1 Tax=Bacillus thuringiensis subsp. entomocidus TaxID=1436 RepID=C0LUV9_BACTE|nr:Cry-like delta-endotoxin [Bacillus thuringiensis serovar entomocidus]